MINETMYGYGASKSSIREIAAYGAARKAQIGAENVFDFSLGNPSVPAPAEVAASLKASAELPPAQVHGYTPANGLPACREAVAASLSRRFSAEMGERPVADADDLYITCGAAASLTITLHAVTNPGDEVIVIAPYFPEYRVWIETCDCTCVEVMADASTFQIDADAVAAAVTERTAAVIIDSPNNPVGSIYSDDNLKELATVLERKSAEYGHPIYLLSDEPYRELYYEEDEKPAWVPSLYRNTLVAYSWSKSMSLPGERIAYILVPPQVDDWRTVYDAVVGAGRFLGYICASTLFQHTVAECIDAPVNKEPYAINRKIFMEGLERIGYTFVKPQGAFYMWIKALEPDANAFYERAKAHELLLVPSDGFGMKGWVRAGYCCSKETIEGALTAFQDLWDEYHN